MSFTKAELDAMRAADAEIEASFSLTEQEIAAAEDRDERAIYARMCGARARAAPKSIRQIEADFQRFMVNRKRKKTYTPEQRERKRAYCKAYDEAHKEQRRKYKAEWYQLHREEILERQLAYHKASEIYKAYQSAYRCKQKEAKGGG